MAYWEGVLARLSIPGITLLALGALMCYEAPKLSAMLFARYGDRATVPMKVAGLGLALLGALILLDIIPQ